MTYDELQRAHRAWLASEYPDQPVAVPTAGCVEEAGELLHAALKLKQASLWGREDRYPKLQEDLIDAVGDCALYLCSLCTTMGWAFADVMVAGDFSELASDASRPDPLQLCVELVKASAELYSDVKQDRAVDYSHLLCCVAGAFDLTVKRCAETAWAVVSRRKRGGACKPRVVCLCGSTRFMDAFYCANLQETLRGRVVLSVGMSNHGAFVPSEQEKASLDELHLRKVEMADEVLVLDMPRPTCSICLRAMDTPHGIVSEKLQCDKCGEICLFTAKPYIGESTAREIKHAKLLGKRVRYISEEGFA